MTLPRTGLVALCLALPPALFGEAALAPSADAHKARDLVRQLGDRSYRVRTKATRDLAALGRHAKDALLAGSRDADAEVSARCRSLLPAALEADLLERVERFAADPEGKQAHELPGWDRYRKIAGDDPAARELFAAMLRAEPRFVASVESDPDTLGDRLSDRCAELYRAAVRRTPNEPAAQLSLADAAVLLLAATEPGVTLQQQTFLYLYQFCYQQAVRNGLTAGPQAPAARKLLVAWLEKQEGVTAVTQGLALVNGLPLKEGVPFAARVAADKTASAYNRAMAMTAVGRFGEAGHLPLLEAAFEDRGPLGPFQVGNATGTTELRDVALAMAVRLTNQSHAQYGFEVARHNPALLQVTAYLGFKDDPARDRAFARWKEWRAGQPK